MKRYMLDTDISSYVIRKRPDSVRDRFRGLDSGQLCVSVISEAELLYGVKAKGSQGRQRYINRPVGRSRSSPQSTR